MTFDRARVAAMCLFLAAAGASAQNANHAPPAVKIETNGTVQVPAHSVPMSSFLTPEGQAYVTEHLLNMQRPEMLAQKDGIPVLVKHLPDWESHKDSTVFASKPGQLEAAIGQRPIFGQIDFTAGTEAVSAVYPAGRLVIVEYTSPQASSEAESANIVEYSSLKKVAFCIR